MRYKVIVGIVGSVLLIISVLLLLSLSTNSKDDHASTVATRLRIGLQANLTHAPALIAKSSDAFSKELGMDVEYRIFKAGPDTMFALLTGQVDVAYTGPIPAIQAYLASNGSVRIIAGVTANGAMFVTRDNINTVEDLRGKRFGTPQYGNTQDVALRSYLLEHGLRLKEDMGDISIINAKSSELLLLFRKHEIDGLWVPEPWASMVLKEQRSRIFLDERSIWPDGRFVTTVLVARSDLVGRSPELVNKVLSVHINTIRWINEHRDEALSIVSSEIKSITGQSLPEDVVKSAFSSLEFTYDPMQGSIEGYIRKGRILGLFPSEYVPSDLFYYDGLKSILEERREE
jgi:NitT/TauT family transport system substrate-binding protein